MRALTAADALSVWERASGRSPGEQALALVAGCSGLAPEAVADLTVGDRDRRLLAAYRGLFGRRAVGRADCPACGERLELDLDLADLDTGPAAPTDPFTVGECEVEWRLPSAGDVAEARARSPEAARDELVRRCVVRVTRGGELVPPSQWPAELAAVLGEAVAAADPLTDVRIGLTCVRCGHGWSIGLDPVAFFWTELDVLARRLLNEVHRLASAYGWREADILSMSAARRATYLRMCGG